MYYERDWADKEIMDNEVSQVKGNVPQDMKRRCLAIFRYFVGMRDTSYGADIGRRLKMVELNVWDHTRVKNAEGSKCETSKKENYKAKYAETIVEIIVEKGVCFIYFPHIDHTTYISDMINVLGTLHGACAAFIVDVYV